MNDYFHLELDAYKNEVNWYGRFSLTLLKNSLLAFESSDLMIAADIIRQKEYVNNQYEILNERGILLIALNQPMAKDLRMISSCMDIVTSSERIGRYAKDITELVVASVPAEIPPDLMREGEAAVSILNSVYTAFESGDMSLLKGCIVIEEEIDTLYARIYKDLVKGMEDGRMSIPFGSACHLVNRYLERCGDHACRMAEKVYYLQTGKRAPLEEISEM
ncbi:Phosphate-specific transport system accessory protein PhoU [bioreactor metagenome]|uniref:Phosphate-specific transport system accessory protein PhoU n=1 Tax=bioreactor metagenome TaxID=1076179 RepID=A0A644VR63_9ZZZZ